MEIDEGPPPFPGVVVVDDSFVKHSTLNEDVEEEDSEAERAQLPLPNDDFRSQSPLNPVNFRKTPEVPEFPEEDDPNDKGDTVTTVVSQVEALKFDDDEDDEWGDFGVAAPAPPVVFNPLPPVAPSRNDDEDDDDDDEWGAFDQARPSESESAPDSARSEAARQIAHQQSLDDWGAFENADATTMAPLPGFQDDDNEWQAEFTAAVPIASAAPALAPIENLKLLENMLDDEDFWDDGFEEDADAETGDSFVDDLRISDIPAIFDSETLADDSATFESEEQRFARLWLSLRVVEEAISLKFDWKESKIRTNHFAAIKISPKIVKKEPRTAAAAFDTSSLLLPTPLQPTSSADASAADAHKTTPPNVESPSIPAADFDWDTSGLTNPMNRANQNSAIIDVDFLSTNGVATSYTSPLQKELEEFGLTLEKGAAGSGTSTLSSSSANILETIMRANESSTTNGRYRSPEVLSLDAQKLLEKLPDLQYLQSEVLMFPVGTNLPH